MKITLGALGVFATLFAASACSEGEHQVTRTETTTTEEHIVHQPSTTTTTEETHTVHAY